MYLEGELNKASRESLGKKKILTVKCAMEERKGSRE